MDVTVYTTPTCLYCHQLKQFLDEKNVTYSEIDLSQDREAAQYIAEATGQMGVPVTRVDDRFVLGFAKDTLADILGV